MVYSYFPLGWHNLVSLVIQIWTILCLNRRVLWVHHTFIFFILVSLAPMVGSPLSGSSSQTSIDSTAWMVAGLRAVPPSVHLARIRLGYWTLSCGLTGAPCFYSFSAILSRNWVSPVPWFSSLSLWFSFCLGLRPKLGTPFGAHLWSLRSSCPSAGLDHLWVDLSSSVRLLSHISKNLIILRGGSRLFF